MPHPVRRLGRWLPLACAIAFAGPALAETQRKPAARGQPGWRTQVIPGTDASLPIPVLVPRGRPTPAMLVGPGLRRAAEAPEAGTPELEGRTITVTSAPRGFLAREEEAGRGRQLVLARGELRGNAFEDLRSAGLPPALGRELLAALAHEVDFQRELSRGGGFAVLFTRPADSRAAGELLQAEFTLAGRRLALWRADTERGAEWFDDQGRSLRRAFLRTPLDSAQVTSGFGMRAHPVLGFTRMHQGIDFAAPTGTPVYAAADGVVTQVERVRGYGRMVMIDHGGGRETRYAHLSRFAPDLKPGSPVTQGSVIGQVGATGTATGPHLHYEVIEAGLSVNPARIRPEPAMQLAGAALAAFQANRQSLATQIAALAPMGDLAAAQ